MHAVYALISCCVCVCVCVSPEQYSVVWMCQSLFIHSLKDLWGFFPNLKHL